MEAELEVSKVREYVRQLGTLRSGNNMKTISIGPLLYIISILLRVAFNGVHSFERKQITHSSTYNEQLTPGLRVFTIL